MGYVEWELLARLQPLLWIGTRQDFCFCPLLNHVPRPPVEGTPLQVILLIHEVNDQERNHHLWLKLWLLSLHADEFIFSLENTALVSCVSQNLNSISQPRVWFSAHGPCFDNVGGIPCQSSARAHQLRPWVDELNHDWVKIHSTGGPGAYDSHWTWCRWRVPASKVSWWCWIPWRLVQSGGACWLHSLCENWPSCSVAFLWNFLMKFVLLNAVVKIFSLFSDTGQLSYSF